MLTDDDFRTALTFTEQGLDWFKAQGLTLRLDPHVANWKRYLQSMLPQHAALQSQSFGKNPGINPSFDPDCCHLHPGNSFWIGCEYQGEIVACLAVRYYETRNFGQMVLSGRVWQDRVPVLHSETRFTSNHLPLIQGRVGYHGGLWVHPDWRRIGLGGALPRFARSVSVRHFEVEWHCGFVFRALASRGYQDRIYGYTHSALVIENAYFEITGQTETLHMPYISLDEMVAQFREPYWKELPEAPLPAPAEAGAGETIRH